MTSLIQNNSLTQSTILAKDATVEKVANEFAKFAEGPIWHPDGYLLVSDIVGDVIWKVFPSGSFEIYRKPSDFSNGRTWDLDGNLLTAEHASRTVTRTAENASITVVASHFEGKRFNSPNDVIVRADGSMYITDPPFGLAPPYGPSKQEPELDFSGVFRIDGVTGAVSLLSRDFKYPNGITFSPDELRLYVNDSATGNITVFDVQPDGGVTNPRLFANLSVPGSQAVVDGMKTDIAGNVYCTAPGGVAVLNAQGILLSKIAVPEQPSAIAWGDSDYQTLYITAETGVYRIRMQIRGTGSGIRKDAKR
ncbi:SMP-30/gluconolactonase/LRE family protein [Scytonema sp. NUACC21]